jgi:hypothetical protein
LNSDKIFGIGFHKTGTTSLARALDLLGYQVTGSFGLMDPNIGKTVVERALDIVPQYDAFQDNPWPIIYKELDNEFPGSKFILTVRPTEKWLASIVRHFSGKTTTMREWIYGVGDPLGNEIIYRDRYERHNHEVQEYFRMRSSDFLVFRLTEGEEWEQLCKFLERETPQVPFPHANSFHERNRLRNKFNRGLARIVSNLQY